MSNENHVRKVPRTLPKRFARKVTSIEEAQDLTTMEIDELIGNLTTFEMTFEPSESNEKKGITLKASCEDEDREDLTKNIHNEKKGITLKASCEDEDRENLIKNIHCYGAKFSDDYL
ncbi:hypothetical protein LIER_11597 [Lithospermum erythrorhizon]|uniref:Gag-pol polyprotein n=1 Tax=Lithospermum erythrorhizon TaxID=34254 RepID=A0AAV3PQ75_LITER